MSDRVHLVTQLFLQARALPEQQRSAFLASACHDDPRLRCEVESFLAHDASAVRLMPDSAPGRSLECVLPDVLSSIEPTVLPKSVGKYPILGLVGRGGMGLVYRTEQDHPRRPVALKVLRPEFVSAASRKRFEYEVEILGRLRHPGIAQIYDAGTCETELGPQPYFAMELIEGRTLLEHAHGQRLTTRQKLELIAAIADAVQYAHQQGVVHRDLKPSNIIVDHAGQPKVLDFGIARASDLDLQATTFHTHAGLLVGTLPYMSPEQVSGDSRSIDTRSDVYALGVNLYQLLTGRLPMDVDDRSLIDSIKILRDQEPMMLGAIDPTLRGDVETIVHKALAKEKSQRYQTAAELAVDIRRFLQDEPILARPASKLYQLRKFTARHRALVISIATTLLVLSAGLTASLVLYRQEKAQATRALSLSAIQRLHELQAAAKDLWPRYPYRRDAMTLWLEQASNLADEIPTLQRFLDELRSLGTPVAGGGWKLPSYDQQWLHDNLTSMIADLRVFADPDPAKGLLADVGQRRRGIDTVVADSIVRYADAWRACLAQMATSASYSGLTLAPQTGLVPLRLDPRSGLWEFWHVESGLRPALDPATDRWRVSPENGLVMVLIPGGTFLMGAQGSDPDAPNYDLDPRPNELPVHSVTLQPFFLSKYEATQAQWERLTGNNPSRVQHDDESVLGIHPVEQVSWYDCTDALPHWGLVLPTEAQWEYACRAGTRMSLVEGERNLFLKHVANIADQSYARANPGRDASREWDDMFKDHAPVGSFEPNRFGLHDIFGNVWEWCRDRFGSYELPVREGDGERQVPVHAKPTGVFRGGSFYVNTREVTPSIRIEYPLDYRDDVLGVRPARPANLDPQ